MVVYITNLPAMLAINVTASGLGSGFWSRLAGAKHWPCSIAHIVLLIYLSNVALMYYIHMSATLGTIYSENKSIHPSIHVIEEETPLPPAISNEGICLLQTTVVPILCSKQYLVKHNQKGIFLMWKKKCNLLVHFLFFSNSSPTDQRS